MLLSLIFSNAEDNLVYKSGMLKSKIHKLDFIDVSSKSIRIKKTIQMGKNS